MNKLAKSVPRTTVNAIRQEILAVCRAAAQQPSGLFSLTVPTGGGKTLSGVAFALDHAVKLGKKRIIYVIPYTSIIEQTAGILRGIFGEENVVEHHSNLDPDNETQRSRLASENWDAPVIVTTNVQFFESLYASKASRCRKLHNIVDSVVILDEAQLLPPELLTPCVDVMNQLVKNYGVTILLSTATQPALPKLDKLVEIIPPNMRLYERLKRINYTIPSDINTPDNWQSIAKQLKQYEQVLSVVNTRRDCYDLFKLMPEDTIHLSALMCGEHRSKVITEIKRLLKEDMPIRVISTQLVEAGVDIDFPIVYRSLAWLDSIAQAAGRCNREGKLNEKEKLGEVHIFIPPKPAPRGLLLKGENTTRELYVCGVDPHQPDAFTRYFDLYYAKVNNTGIQFYDWLVKDVNPTVNIQFRTAAANFNFIDDHAQRPVFVSYGESEKWIRQVRSIGPTRDNMRHLQRYTVNLSKFIFDRVMADGLLEDIWESEYWRWIPKYDSVIGLDIFGGGWTPEDLMQ
jgi:CRISPR-associated endonuclease/helicase Cas3